MNSVTAKVKMLVMLLFFGGYWFTGTLSASPVQGAYTPGLGDYQVFRVRSCQRRMGPYATQTRAWQVLRQFRSRGFQTSNVWGSGGFYSRNSRGYYFNVFFRC